jgi:SAM-dependent methyltransferase
MYGPMFGSTSLPEQLSPHEWRGLAIPFTGASAAWFYACRTGRWFAPFFARTFGVPAWGCFGYTTFSLSPTRYRRVPDEVPPGTSVYVVDQPGRKSHGYLGTLGKHLGVLPPRPMVRHEPARGPDRPAYDDVAHLYDAVFEDIRVRGPEWRWLRGRMSPDARVLDVGCGTGSLVRALQGKVRTAVGVDVSPAMVARARDRDPAGRYEVIAGPDLPFLDQEFDIVVSLLSWRYVDWDPMLAEVMRVLRPGGRFLVVDMVAKPAEPAELPLVVVHKGRELIHLRRFPAYAAHRRRLTADPGWKRMLAYNPIRAEHEYRWYFESRFPGRTIETLDIGRTTRILAFDTGPVTTRWHPPQSYP